MSAPVDASLLVAAALVLGGCDDVLPRASFVEKLRMLAVQAEPPEVAPGASSLLRALAVGPAQPVAGAAPLSALWLACRVPPGSTSIVPCGLGPEEPLGARLPPACGTEVDGTLCVLGTELTASLRPSASLLGASGSATLFVSLAIADTDRGAAACYLDTAANGGLPTEPDRCVLAVKRLTVADPLRAPASPPNRNPALERLELVDADGTVRSLLGGDAILPAPVAAEPPARSLRTQRAEGAAEQVEDGRYEALSLSWFTTAGQINGGRSTFDPPDCQTQEECARRPPVTTATTEWVAPSAIRAPLELAADGAIRFWAVLRDDRGGVGWQEGRLLLR